MGRKSRAKRARKFAERMFEEAERNGVEEYDIGELLGYTGDRKETGMKVKFERLAGEEALERLERLLKETED